MPRTRAVPEQRMQVITDQPASAIWIVGASKRLSPRGVVQPQILAVVVQLYLWIAGRAE